MAWELRNGNRYYYRKARVGQKVVSIYVGKGPKARQAALQDLLCRLEKEKQRRQIDETDQALAQLEKQALQLLALALLAAGYRKVKGQWRKPRAKRIYTSQCAREPTRPPNLVYSRSMKAAVVFPGQGAQRPGMGRDFYDQSPAAREVFETASRLSGRSFAQLCFESDEETLRNTENAQPALLTVGYAGWRALKEAIPDFLPAYFAGHSMGEYTALAASETLTFEETFHWIDIRARAMKESGFRHPGSMVAILGLDAETAQAACDAAQAATGEIVAIANFNCPGQLVVSGQPKAVEAAVEECKARGAKRAIPLAVAGPFHSPMMQEAADQMYGAYEQANFKAGIAPVVANVTARPVTDPGQWRRIMASQVAQPVRWQESIEWMTANGVDTFIEIGVGDVLTGLIKRIAPDATMLKATDGASLAATIEAIKA